MVGLIGLVIECWCLFGECDGLLWFCVVCNYKFYEEYFEFKDIEYDFLFVFVWFYELFVVCICVWCGIVYLVF